MSPITISLFLVAVEQMAGKAKGEAAALREFDQMPSWQVVVMVDRKKRGESVNTDYLDVCTVPESKRNLEALKLALNSSRAWGDRELKYVMGCVSKRNTLASKERSALLQYYRKRGLGDVESSNAIFLRVQDDWNKANLITRYLYAAPYEESWPLTIDKKGRAKLLLTEKSKPFYSQNLGSLGADPLAEYESFSFRFRRR